MKILKQIPYLFIIGLIIYIIFLRECTPPKIVDNYKTDTIYSNDTTYIPQVDTVHFTDTLYVDSIINHTIINERIDTVYILRQHFTNRIYTDTILNDVRGLIIINDTLYRNRIKSRYNSIKLFRDKPIIKNKYFLGGGVIGSQDRLGLMANVGLLTKRNKLYTAGYDFINKDVSLSLYIKIK